MRLTRIFVDEPLETGREQRLGAAAAAHVARVLRLGAGDELTVFDGRGGEYPATIIESRGTLLRVRIGTHRDLERESTLRITLAQGVSRGERMDWVVQKATELGVAAIVPLITERSVVRLDTRQAGKRRAHWRAIVVAACEQSGRNRLPEVLVPQTLAHWLETAPRDEPRLLLDPTASSGMRARGAMSAVTLLIGPEGGLSPAERSLAMQAGFNALRLGPRVLRTETAAIAALSALQALQGDAG
ncbi:MAG TPA: 16S rRNA (uracil(1498)-N(3))-methyltransferase [Steroidobacteraceae bacterium]|nr:16S rRNA (uracil(1498)-N(3))-methyltransferase [Steroidobacteraceae bacterium]